MAAPGSCRLTLPKQAELLASGATINVNLAAVFIPVPQGFRNDVAVGGELGCDFLQLHSLVRHGLNFLRQRLMLQGRLQIHPSVSDGILAARQRAANLFKRSPQQYMNLVTVCSHLLCDQFRHHPVVVQFLALAGQRHIDHRLRGFHVDADRERGRLRCGGDLERLGQVDFKRRLQPSTMRASFTAMAQNNLSAGHQAKHVANGINNAAVSAANRFTEDFLKISDPLPNLTFRGNDGSLVLRRRKIFKLRWILKRSA